MSPAARRWSAVLADADRSGLSLRAFALQEGHNPNTLAWWRWNLRQRQQPTVEPTRLAQVIVVDEVGRDEAAVLHVRIAGADIVVQPHTDLGLLRRVVQALQ